MIAIATWFVVHVGLAGLLPLLGSGSAIGVAGYLLGFGRIKSFFGEHRDFLLLLAACAAAASLYAWGAIGRADRDRLHAWAELACTAAASDYDQARGKAGSDCLTAVKALTAFKHQTAQDSAKVLTTHLTNEAQSAAADAASARTNAERANAAAAAMEKANAGIGPDNRVNGDWFRTLNDAAGLRR